ncbi:hypothetical protein [Ralstonia sp. RL]|uniref:hypothetical protein n=1 Tax=Ralstonia sp. RL TaxID=1839756 RepID=UPI00257EDAA9|nr:hypothetical protein [Ralstonia sp. RL]
MQRKFKVAVNRRIINKIDRDDKVQARILTQEFENLELTPTELADFINDGHPFCAHHEGGRKEANFRCSDVLAVDIDGGMQFSDTLQDPYVQQYASIVYTTPSHTADDNRFRIVCPATIRNSGGDN